MKRLIVALTVAALLALFTLPALAMQVRPTDPTVSSITGLRMKK